MHCSQQLFPAFPWKTSIQTGTPFPSMNSPITGISRCSLETPFCPRAGPLTSFPDRSWYVSLGAAKLPPSWKPDRGSCPLRGSGRHHFRNRDFNPQIPFMLQAPIAGIDFFPECFRVVLVFQIAKC